MTAVKWMLLPLFLHVVLIAIVGIQSVRARIKSVVSGRTRISDIAMSPAAWPDEVRKFGNNFDNQFQTPMLWYGAMALVAALSLADFVFATLSWLFLASRVGHSYIHTGRNNVPLRMRVFLAGFAVVFLMWAWLAVKIYFGTAA